MTQQENAVRFLLPWRGRVPGQEDRALDYGVMAVLVQRGIAAWIKPEAPADEAPRKPRKRG